MQESLFDDEAMPCPIGSAPGSAAARDPRRAAAPEGTVSTQAPETRASRKDRRSQAPVLAARADRETLALGAALPPEVFFGTSSWFFPGWADLVWDRVYERAQLSRRGLPAYARHPLLRTVGIDRSFYRPLTALQYADYASQVPDAFRFVVKAPSLVTDAMQRDESGRGMRENPAFLDPVLAVREFIEPALAGLGAKVGALVFQLSPLPASWLGRMPEMLDRLERLLVALPPLGAAAPDGVVAVELRNRELLTPAFAELLRRAGATYCLGLHAKMPPIEEQLPLLRALWPAPLVCRWSLNRRHGAYGYEEAKTLYEPFDRIVDADLPTRETLARVIVGTVEGGQRAFVTVNNKAEGSAPLTVLALAQAVSQRMLARAQPQGATSGPSSSNR